MVHLVKTCLVIRVEPDSSNDSLNTMWDTCATNCKCTVLLCSVAGMLFFICLYIPWTSAWCHFLHETLWPTTVDRGSVNAHLSTQHRLRCHTHVAWPSVSKARLQKFPLLIVCVHVCVLSMFKIKPVKQRRWPQQDIGHVAGLDLAAALQQHDLLFKDKLLIVFHLHLNPV